MEANPITIAQKTQLLLLWSNSLVATSEKDRLSLELNKWDAIQAETQIAIWKALINDRKSRPKIEESKPARYGFYMLYVEGSSSPTVKHFNPHSAMEEAERLASVSGREVHILQGLKSITCAKKYEETIFVPPAELGSAFAEPKDLPF